MLEPAIRDLATGKNFATLSVHLPNGQIATHVMWVDADDEHVLINTEIHRAKYKAMKADPNVTVTIWKLDRPLPLRRGARDVVDRESAGAGALATSTPCRRSTRARRTEHDHRASV